MIHFQTRQCTQPAQSMTVFMREYGNAQPVTRSAVSENAQPVTRSAEEKPSSMAEVEVEAKSVNTGRSQRRSPMAVVEAEAKSVTTGRSHHCRALVEAEEPSALAELASSALLEMGLASHRSFVILWMALTWSRMDLSSASNSSCTASQSSR